MPPLLTWSRPTWCTLPLTFHVLPLGFEVLKVALALPIFEENYENVNYGDRDLMGKTYRFLSRACRSRLHTKVPLPEALMHDVHMRVPFGCSHYSLLLSVVKRTTAPIHSLTPPANCKMKSHLATDRYETFHFDRAIIPRDALP